MTTVAVAASALAAALIDAGPCGSWVAEAVADHELATAELALFEAANVLRRLLLRASSARPKRPWRTQTFSA